MNVEICPNILNFIIKSQLKTLSKIIDSKRGLKCNEAPDSRNILGALDGHSKIKSHVVHHSVKQGENSNFKFNSFRF